MSKEAALGVLSSLYAGTGTIDVYKRQVEYTLQYLEVLHRLGHECPQLDAQLCHIIASGMFNGIFEIVVHDMPKEQAMHYVCLLYTSRCV